MKRFLLYFVIASLLASTLILLFREVDYKFSESGMAEREPPRAKEVFKKIVKESSELKHKLALETYPTFAERSRLASLWEEYIRYLPRDVVETEALAVIGYPEVIMLKDIPRKIRTDPEFAKIIIEMYGG